MSQQVAKAPCLQIQCTSHRHSQRQHSITICKAQAVLKGWNAFRAGTLQSFLSWQESIQETPESLKQDAVMLHCEGSLSQTFTVHMVHRNTDTQHLEMPEWLPDRLALHRCCCGDDAARCSSLAGQAITRLPHLRQPGAAAILQIGPVPVQQSALSLCQAGRDGGLCYLCCCHALWVPWLSLVHHCLLAVCWLSLCWLAVGLWGSRGRSRGCWGRAIVCCSTCIAQERHVDM